MKRFFVNKEIVVNNNLIIDGIEHNHIKNVMRMQVGDEIILVCGDDFDYYATITKMSKGDTQVIVTGKEINQYNPKNSVTVFQALVKSDNMALIVQKLTELGVTQFVPFESEFITSKDKFGKVNKLQEISNQSVKQCKRSRPMEVTSVMSFDGMLKSLGDYDLVIFANECENVKDLSSCDIKSGMKIAIIIGSEGGFSPNEITKLNGLGVISVSLGRRILRAETASIALTAVVMNAIGEWRYE